MAIQDSQGSRGSSQISLTNRGSRTSRGSLARNRRRQATSKIRSLRSGKRKDRSETDRSFFFSALAVLAVVANVSGQPGKSDLVLHPYSRPIYPTILRRRCCGRCIQSRVPLANRARYLASQAQPSRPSVPFQLVSSPLFSSPNVDECLRSAVRTASVTKTDEPAAARTNIATTSGFVRDWLDAPPCDMRASQVLKLVYCHVPEPG